MAACSTAPSPPRSGTCRVRTTTDHISRWPFRPPGTPTSPRRCRARCLLVTEAPGLGVLGRAARRPLPTGCSGPLAGAVTTAVGPRFIQPPALSAGIAAARCGPPPTLVRRCRAVHRSTDVQIGVVGPWAGSARTEETVEQLDPNLRESTPMASSPSRRTFLGFVEKPGATISTRASFVVQDRRLCAQDA